MTYNCWFSYFETFCREIHQKGPIMLCFEGSFVYILKTLNKQSNYWWYETPCRSVKITVKLYVYCYPLHTLIYRFGQHHTYKSANNKWCASNMETVEAQGLHSSDHFGQSYQQEYVGQPIAKKHMIYLTSVFTDAVYNPREVFTSHITHTRKIGDIWCWKYQGNLLTTQVIILVRYLLTI